MLERGEHDLVARLQELAAVGLGDQVDPFGGPADEDDLLGRRSPQKGLHLLPRLLDRRRSPGPPACARRGGYSSCRARKSSTARRSRFAASASWPRCRARRAACRAPADAGPENRGGWPARRAGASCPSHAEQTSLGTRAVPRLSLPILTGAKTPRPESVMSTVAESLGRTRADRRLDRSRGNAGVVGGAAERRRREAAIRRSECLPGRRRGSGRAPKSGCERQRSGARRRLGLLGQRSATDRGFRLGNQVRSGHSRYKAASPVGRSTRE